MRGHDLAASRRSAGRRGKQVVVALTLVLVGVGSASAAAEVCVRSATVAAGAPEYFEFAAVSQAKAAWARKVGRDKALGRPYSSWARANAARVTCRQIGGRHRCIAVGEPCRSGGR